MSLSDIELVELEEQRSAAPSPVDHDGQIQSSASALAPSPPSSVPSPPHVAPPSTPPPQIATPLAPAASEPFAEQLHRILANLSQAAPAAPNATTQEPQDSYLHPADKFWSLYLKEADIEDKHLVESWKGDTDGILIFTGLFAATVATFVTQTYQLLIPPPDDPSAAILMQVSQQLVGSWNGTLVPAYIVPTSQPPFQPPFYAIWVNTLWFLSLSLSLTGALMATLMQQWTRRYLRGIQYRSAPHVRGPMQVMLRMGVKKYKMKQAATLITAILHASVFIFFAGLVGFAFHLHSTVARVLTSCVSALAAAYISLSILPMISTVAPYDTVLTPLFQASLSLSRILFALALKQIQKARLFLLCLHRDKDSTPLLEAAAHDGEEHRSHSREQALMSIIGKDSCLTIPHATYALDRTLTNADEHHEVENFLDSMAALLSDERHDFSSLINDSTLETMFKEHLLRDKIWSLVYSCTSSTRSEMSLTARIKRLRTVLAFIRHEKTREIANLSELVKESSSYQNYILSELGNDQTLSVSFLSRLIRICFLMEAEVLDGEIHRYHLSSAYAEAAAYGYYGEGTVLVAWPLFCLVETVCVILRFASSDGANDPVAAYRHLWEPILHDAWSYAIDYLNKNTRESDDLIVEPIPRALLFQAGLEDLIHPFYALPARRPPTSEEQLKIKHAFSTYPNLVHALRRVAGIPSLIPLYGPLPQPNPGPGGSLTQPGDSSTVTRTSPGNRTGSGCVLFGPLTWGDRPGYEYYRLIYAWNRSLTDNLGYYDVLRGEGYARIFFYTKAGARRFADAWTANPLPAYWTVTAELLDDGEGSMGENGEGDEIDAGEEGEDSRSEIDGSESAHDGRNWVESCWGSIFSNGNASRRDRRPTPED